MEELKKRFIEKYGKDKLKVIEKDGIKYVDANFMNWVIQKVHEMSIDLQKTLSEFDWTDTAKKIMEVKDGQSE